MLRFLRVYASRSRDVSTWLVQRRLNLDMKRCLTAGKKSGINNVSKSANIDILKTSHMLRLLHVYASCSRDVFIWLVKRHLNLGYEKTSYSQQN